MIIYINLLKISFETISHSIQTFFVIPIKVFFELHSVDLALSGVS